MSETQKHTNATKHYAYYPDEKDIPTYLAYGFRAIFLLLAPYIVISSILWGFTWSGVINPFTDDILTWHIYEFMYGVGIAGAMAFIFTGIPELFPGMVPFVGKRLRLIVGLWALGRVSFWFVDYLGVYLVGLINILPLLWVIIWAFKPVVLDKLQRHASIGYTLSVLLVLQIVFFLTLSGNLDFVSFDILKLALGAFMVLILLALRRVNMEALNEIIEDEELDDIFIAYPYRYNLAIFTVSLYTIVEFFYPDSSTLGWIALSSAAAILAILNDYNLKFESIIFKPYTIFLGTTLVLMSLGYASLGYDILDEDIYALSHFSHFLTTGAYGLSFFMVMVIISYVHTGRKLKANFTVFAGVILIVIATFLRVAVPFFEEYAKELYIYSSILWALPFILYIKQFFPYLLNKRADGIKG